MPRSMLCGLLNIFLFMYLLYSFIWLVLWCTKAGKARIQIYEQQVKQTFSKAYNYPSYNAKEEAQMYFKGVPYTANGLGVSHWPSSFL